MSCALKVPFNAKQVRNRQQKSGITAKGDRRQFVQHNYVDHMDEEDELAGIHGINLLDRYELPRYNQDGTEANLNKKTKPSPLFPLKLYMILSEVEIVGNSNVISWLPHGRAFYIRNNDLFSRKILPLYFKNCKISSFYRQLNLYGFVRLTAGINTGAYYHEYFLRGKPFLTRNLVRTKVKGTKIRAASSPQDEPDFYSMRALSSSVPMNIPEKNSNARSIAPSGNSLGMRLTATNMHEKSRGITMSTSQYERANCTDPRIAHRISDEHVRVRSTMPSYDNSIDAQLANRISDTHVRTMSRVPIFNRSTSNSRSANDRNYVERVIDIPTDINNPMNAKMMYSRYLSTSADPDSYRNPLIPIRSRFVPDLRHYHATDPYLHDNVPFRIPLSLSNNPQFSQNSRSLQAMRASQTREDGRTMPSVARELGTQQQAPASNMPLMLNRLQNEIPLRDSDRKGSMQDMIHIYLRDKIHRHCED